MVERVRRFLSNSGMNLSEILARYHPEAVSTLELRKALRELRMGLLPEEVDQLCSLCKVDAAGMVRWGEFVRVFRLRETDAKMLSRADVHMRKMNEHLYFHMISPRDAFRHFDSRNRGTLDFGQFAQLVEQLFSLAREEVPPIPIVKDLFHYIDKRNDGVLDLREWIDAFRKYPAGTRRVRSYSLSDK